MTQNTGILAGELGLISLFDLGQLLMLNRATGVLAVTHDGVRGSLIFNAGALVNAIDDQRKQGTDAAHRVFSWKLGRFEFHSEPTSDQALIEGGTEAIMLDAARRMDESSPAATAAGVQPETLKLVERQSRFDLLREEFSRVTREAVGEIRRAPEWSDPWLDMLQEPGDRLLVRPYAVPRLYTRGEWRPAAPGDAPTDQQAYDELKDRLVAGDAHGDLDAMTRRCVVRHRGHAYSITLVRGSNESLWVATAASVSVTGDAVTGPFETLDQLFARPSAMVIAAAPSLDAAHSLLRALVVRLAETRGITIVVVTDDLVLRPRESAGVVLAALPAEADSIVHAARPGAIAVDALCTIDGAVLAALATTPLVLGAVVAATPESIVPRWLMRFTASDLARAQSLLDSTPVAVVLAEPGASDRSLTFTVHRVGGAGAAAPRRDPMSPVDLLR